MACITNAAYVLAAGDQASAIVQQATIDAAIQVGIALWQRNASESISNMQIEIADDQMQLAEEVEAHAEKFWPEEKELVDDVFGESKIVTQYIGLSAEFSGIANASLQQGRTNWIDTMRSLCMAPSRCEDARWQRNAQSSRADMISFAARQDESRTEIINDRRYARQYAVLQSARGRLGDLLSYQAIGGTVGASAASMLTNTINSALSAYGYYPNRHEPGGWGAGIRDTWTGTYMPPAAPAQQATPLPAQPLLPPVAPPAPVRQTVTLGKGPGEIQAGIEIAEEMQRLRQGVQ